VNSKPRFYNILSKIIASTEDQINRDFHELSFLQSAKNLPYGFAKTLPLIIKKNIINKCEYLLPGYGIIFNGEVLNPPEIQDSYIVLDILPESDNLLRSLPFISCSAFIGKINDELITKDIEAAIIFLPLYNKIIWADKASEQVMCDNKKLKTSQVTDISHANICNKITNTGINCGSINFEISLLIEAKLDIFISNFANELSIKAAEFIANMAGATSVIDRKNSIVKIAANKYLILENLK
jgi:hypothetical protein